MPLAKLSERFYQRFGHDLVEELVGWLNQMDTTYRDDLRELNELNFARFDAKLEQRAAQLESKLEQRAAQLESKLEQRAAQLESKLELRVAQLEAKLEAQSRMLVKWMLGIWILTVPTLAGVITVVQHFLPAGP